MRLISRMTTLHEEKPAAATVSSTAVSSLTSPPPTILDADDDTDEVPGLAPSSVSGSRAQNEDKVILRIHELILILNNLYLDV